MAGQDWCVDCVGGDDRCVDGMGVHGVAVHKWGGVHGMVHWHGLDHRNGVHGVAVHEWSGVHDWSGVHHWAEDFVHDRSIMHDMAVNQDVARVTRLLKLCVRSLSHHYAVACLPNHGPFGW